MNPSDDNYSRSTKELLGLSVLELGLTLPFNENSGMERPYFKKSYLMAHADEKWKSFPGGASFVKELMEFDVHCVTHVDAFNHRAEYGVGYRGANYTAPAEYPYGANTIPTIKGRGVLIDLPKFVGADVLPFETEISSQLLQDCMFSQGLQQLEEADTVLIRTGHVALWKEGHFDKYFERCPGLSTEAADWLVDQKIMAIGADNFSVEKIPTPQHWKTEFYPVHKLCLMEKGIYLIENLDLDELSEKKIYTFLFVGAPSRFGNASGAIINPVAIY